MSLVISIFNQAVGVGKSTLTMNLGYQLRKRGHKVLLIDLAPQSSLTSFIGIDPERIEKTPFDAIIQSEPLFIRNNQHSMDIAPININLSVAEIQLVNMEFRSRPPV